MGVKTKPSSPKGLETKSVVLAAAAKCFRDKGYAAASLRDIAKASGLTTGSLYYHYTSKEDIVGEVLIQGHVHIRRSVENAVRDEVQGGTHGDVIRCALRAHIMCLFGEDSLPSANIKIFSQVPEEVKAISLASRHQYENLWIELLSKAQGSGWLKEELDPKIVMPLLFGAINWTIEWADSDEANIDMIVDQISAMLKA